MDGMWHARTHIATYNGHCHCENPVSASAVSRLATAQGNWRPQSSARWIPACLRVVVVGNNRKQARDIIRTVAADERTSTGKQFQQAVRAAEQGTNASPIKRTPNQLKTPKRKKTSTERYSVEARQVSTERKKNHFPLPSLLLTQELDRSTDSCHHATYYEARRTRRKGCPRC